MENKIWETLAPQHIIWGDIMDEPKNNLSLLEFGYNIRKNILE